MADRSAGDDRELGDVEATREHPKESNSVRKKVEILKFLFVFQHFSKYGPNPSSFCLYLSFSQYNDKYSMIDYEWENRKWSAWD